MQNGAARRRFESAEYKRYALTGLFFSLGSA